MKYGVNCGGRFASLDQTRQWMADFMHWYTSSHLHSFLGYLTPEQMRIGKAAAREADATNPERWGSRVLRQWRVPRQVVCNR